jgi:hypothetical protein
MNANARESFRSIRVHSRFFTHLDRFMALEGLAEKTNLCDLTRRTLMESTLSS